MQSKNTEHISLLQKHLPKENFFRVILLSLIVLLVGISFLLLLQPVILENSHFQGIAINGAFQMLNPLHRMDLGQIPGKDFQFFHGIGTLLLHRPLYLLFGKNLFASEISTYITSFLLFVVTLYFFLRSIGIKKAYVWLLVPLLTAFFSFHTSGIVFPNHNTLGVRSFFPLLTTAILILQAKKDFWFKTHLHKHLFRIFWGLLSAVSFFISIEHGLAFIAASFVVHCVCPPIRGSLIQNVLALGIYVLSLLGGVFVLFWVTTNGSWREALKFALVEIPADQFWYFGVSPHTIIEDYFSFLTNWRYEYYKFIFAGIFLGFLTFFLFQKFKNQKEKRALFSFLTLLLIYGIISTFGSWGYLADVYFYTLFKVNVLIIFALLVIFLRKKKFLSLFWSFFLQTTSPQRKTRIHALKKLILGFSGVLLGFGILLFSVPFRYTPHLEYLWDHGTSFFLLAFILFHAITFLNSKKKSFPTKYTLVFVLLFSFTFMPWEGLTKTLPRTIFKGKEFFRKQNDILPFSSHWYTNTKMLEEIFGPMPHTQYSLSSSSRFSSYPSYHYSFLFDKNEVPEGLKAGSFIEFPSKRKAQVKDITLLGKKIKITIGTPKDAPEKNAKKILTSLPFSPPSQGDLWSTYAHFLEHGYGLTHPDTDYIIHTLGPDRRDAYAKKFRDLKPQYVITVRSGYSVYEERMHSGHWDFVEPLITNYEPLVMTKFHVLWKRSQAPWNKPSSWEKEISFPKKGSLSLDFLKENKSTHQTISDQIAVLELHYKVENPFLKVPFIGKTNRYMIQLENTLSKRPISLPPYRKSIQIPIHFEQGKTPLITTQIISPFHIPSTFSITKIRYKLLDLPEENIHALKY